MGEKIRIVGEYGGILDVELNKASVQGGNRWIHIQNDKFRLCVPEKDYVMAAVAVMKAGEKFRGIKEI